MTAGKAKLELRFSRRECSQPLGVRRSVRVDWARPLELMLQLRVGRTGATGDEGVVVRLFALDLPTGKAAS